MKPYYFLKLVLFFFCLPLAGNGQDLKEDKKELVIQVDKKNASSDNSSDGFISLEVSGGKAPYKITCFGPYAVPNTTTGKELKLAKIKAGSYLFVIQDNSGKSITKEVLISNTR